MSPLGCCLVLAPYGKPLGDGGLWLPTPQSQLSQSQWLLQSKDTLGRAYRPYLETVKEDLVF